MLTLQGDVISVSRAVRVCACTASKSRQFRRVASHCHQLTVPSKTFGHFASTLAAKNAENYPPTRCIVTIMLYLNLSFLSSVPIVRCTLQPTQTVEHDQRNNAGRG